MTNLSANLMILIFALVAGISNCRADISIRVVSNYPSAGLPETWTQVAESDIPDVLLKNVTMPTPSKAYADPYKKIFLQNERVIVCYEACDVDQPLDPGIRKSDKYNITGDGHDKVRLTRVTSAYYWINQLFDRMAELGYTPTKQLSVLVDRDVADPTSGIELANNAFFNPKDWSLSLLPSHRAIYAKYKSMDVANAANDPSVVMHETSHSIFQELIGSILNSEVYGLHEAFADYFSLSLLDSPKMGLIAGKGQAIRTAAEKLTYTPGMEAHDLGNVVVAALWRIRGLFSDPLVADRVALETVREVSLNPYSTAGDVVSGYLAAFKTTAASEAQKNPNLELSIQAIWNESQLKPSENSLDLTLLHAPLKRTKSVAAKISTEMPSELATSFSMPARTTAEISQFEWRAVSSDPNLVFYRVGYTESTLPDTDATSFWILYDKKTGCLLGAYDLNGALIERDSFLFTRLLGIGSSLNEMILLTSDFSSEARELYIASDEGSNSPYSGFFHVGSVDVSTLRSNVNNANIKVNVNRRKIRPNFVSGLLGRLDPVGLGALLHQTTSVTLYSITQDELRGNMELTPLPDVADANKQYIIGYSETSETGATHSLILRKAN